MNEAGLLLQCAGKSTLAQQLASRLNMPNVLQTDAICEARPPTTPLRKDHHANRPGCPSRAGLCRLSKLMNRQAEEGEAVRVTTHCMRAQLMRMAEDGPLQRAPLWEREDLGAPQGGLVLEYLRECRVVRKALDGSLAKVGFFRHPGHFACHVQPLQQTPCRFFVGCPSMPSSLAGLQCACQLGGHRLMAALHA